MNKAQQLHDVGQSLWLIFNDVPINVTLLFSGEQYVPAAEAYLRGIAIGGRTYRAYRELLASPRWRTLSAAGARSQRLLWASTGVKDPKASDTLYVEALAASDTIDTVSGKNAARLCGARRDQRRNARGWRRCRSRAGELRHGRHRYRRARHPAAA